MPDRAVVDDFIERYPDAAFGFALNEAIPKLKQQAIEEYKASQPRALVALSEDQKDMVLLNKEHGWWLGFRRVTNDFKYITLACKDHGQDAERALADWMADDE